MTAPPLALTGGSPVRTIPMPLRRSLGPAEAQAARDALDYYLALGLDLPYDGVFQRRFADSFSQFLGGGHSVPVSSGTAAAYVSLAALNLPRRAEVIISPFCDSGPVNAIVLLGLIPVIADGAPGRFTADAATFADRIGPATRAILAVHSLGEAIHMAPVAELAARHGLKLIEDCSQAPGAHSQGRRIGTFGDVAFLSTMSSKTLQTGSCGGLVFTKDEALAWQIRAHADRGKQLWRDDIDMRDPSKAMFPALNLNSTELGCAIGLASLARLEETIAARRAFVDALTQRLAASATCRAYDLGAGSSPFVCPILVDTGRISGSATDFARAVAAEGIPLSPHYPQLIVEWPYVQAHFGAGSGSPSAMRLRDNSFNVYLNERYGEDEAEDVAQAILKVGHHFWRAA